jgi:hypothetical protein
LNPLSREAWRAGSGGVIIGDSVKDKRRAFAEVSRISDKRYTLDVHIKTKHRNKNFKKRTG